MKHSLYRWFGVTLATLVGVFVFAHSTAHADEQYIVDTFVDELDGSCDDGDCSLRDAMADPNNHNYINIYVPAGTYTLDTPVLGALTLSEHATIRGAGIGQTIIQADTTPGTAVDRVMTLTSTDDPITLRGMTIQHGNVTGSGGGISFVGYGDMVLVDVLVTENDATNSGGGIYMEADNTDYGVTLALRDSFIGSNNAQFDGGGFHFRAFDNGDGVVIDNTQIVNNTAGDEGGGGFVDANFNSVYAVWTTISRGSVIANNQAQNDGGGLYFYDYDSMTITITDTLFESNEAGLSGAGNGGGMYVYDNDYGYVTIADTTFRNNSTSDDGGGLYEGYAYHVEMDNVTFEDNTAGDEGGAAYLAGGYGGYIYDSTFTDNTANYGGAMYINKEPMFIENTSITGNTALIDGGALSILTYDISILNTTIAMNYAVGTGQACHGVKNLDSLGGNTVDDWTACGDNTGAIVASDVINLLDDFSFEDDSADWGETADAGSFIAYGGAYQGDHIYLFQSNGGQDLIGQIVPYGGVASDEVSLTYYLAGQNVPAGALIGAMIELEDSGSTVQTKQCAAGQSGTFGWTEITCSVTANVAFDSVAVTIGSAGVNSGLFGIDYVIIDIEDPIPLF